MKRIVSFFVRATVPLLVVAVLVCTAISPHAQPGGDPLAAGFRNPPDSARPRTWWHWTMSNVTRDGKDAAIAARPVYELFGRDGPATDAFPPAGQIVGDALAYYMHTGGHGMVPGDWAVFLDFLERQFKGSRSAR